MKLYVYIAAIAAVLFGIIYQVGALFYGSHHTSGLVFGLPPSNVTAFCLQKGGTCTDVTGCTSSNFHFGHHGHVRVHKRLQCNSTAICCLPHSGVHVHSVVINRYGSGFRRRRFGGRRRRFGGYRRFGGAWKK